MLVPIGVKRQLKAMKEKLKVEELELYNVFIASLKHV
jgi:hypothetical protein